MRPQRLAVVVLAGIVSAGFLAPAFAEKGDMRIQFGLLQSMPMDDFTEDGQTTEFDEAFGVQVSFEYMLADRIGLESSITTGNYDIEVEEGGFPDLDLGEMDLLALTANLNFHLLQDKRADLFVGPTVGYGLWGDLETDLQDFSTDDEFIYGVNLGVDVPCGKGQWGFAAAVNYLFSEVSLKGSNSDLGVDPLQIKIGASYRF